MKKFIFVLSMLCTATSFSMFKYLNSRNIGALVGICYNDKTNKLLQACQEREYYIDTEVEKQFRVIAALLNKGPSEFNCPKSLILEKIIYKYGYYKDWAMQLIKKLGNLNQDEIVTGLSAALDHETNLMPTLITAWHKKIPINTSSFNGKTFLGKIVGISIAYKLDETLFDEFMQKFGQRVNFDFKDNYGKTVFDYCKQQDLYPLDVKVTKGTVKGWNLAIQEKNKRRETILVLLKNAQKKYQR